MAFLRVKSGEERVEPFAIPTSSQRSIVCGGLEMGGIVALAACT